LYSIWPTIAAEENMLVEVPNTHVTLSTDQEPFWVARIVKFCGYKAIIKFEDLGTGIELYDCVLMTPDIPKPLGYCMGMKEVLNARSEIAYPYQGENSYSFHKRL